MKTLVSIPDEVETLLEDHRKEHYPDLTIPKMLVRIALDEAKRERRGE